MLSVRGPAFSCSDLKFHANPLFVFEFNFDLKGLLMLKKLLLLGSAFAFGSAGMAHADAIGTTANF